MDIAVIVQAIGDLDPVHVWAWNPIVPVGGDPDVLLLARVLDTDVRIAGETGFLLWMDMVPVLAVVGQRVHHGGSSTALPDDPWNAIGTMLFLIDAARHSIP